MGKNSYLIHEGILYEASNVVFGQDDIRTAVNLELVGTQFRVNDVFNDIRLNAVDGLFLPTFDGGRVVAIRSVGRRQNYLVEFEPSIRWMKFTADLVRPWSDSDDPVSLRLAFPYVELFIQLHTDGSISISPYYRNSQIGSLNDWLFEPNLTNIHDGNGSMCINLSRATSQLSIVGKLGQTVYSFWNSIYTNELTNRWEGSALEARGHPGSFYSWVWLSMRRNWKKAITSIEWLPTNKTVDQLMGE